MYRVLSHEEKRSRAKTTVTLLIDAPLRERLERMAAASDRSLEAEARQAIREHVRRHGETDDEETR
jgi:predicted transcriptional regulator